ncbi:unnamed protein product [Trichogramma brassicae]|uniref:Uncharacterized protein n=1 Tax=Trichogramma brassicae TaxID=86971 RepID=A0A6H5IPR5_9HYME|nr:unnamed protein product [Trichogramma brassicae]
MVKQTTIGKIVDDKAAEFLPELTKRDLVNQIKTNRSENISKMERTKVTEATDEGPETSAQQPSNADKAAEFSPELTKRDLVNQIKTNRSENISKMERTKVTEATDEGPETSAQQPSNADSVPELEIDEERVWASRTHCQLALRRLAIVARDVQFTLLIFENMISSVNCTSRATIASRRSVDWQCVRLARTR